MAHQDPIPMSHKILYSGLSGAIATTCIYPIDITKTKLMNQTATGSAAEFKGPLQTFFRIIQLDGFKGLYRGWPPNVLFVMPEKAIKLTANDKFREIYADMRTNKDLPVWLEMLAGGSAGFCQVIMTNPMELLKIQGATMNEKLKTGELKTKKSYMQLCRELKVSGLYTGVISTLARDIPFSMVYFTLYSQCKAWLMGPNHANQPTSALGIKPFLSGAIAGTIAAAITCPIDVIKTRVHAAAKPQPGLSFSQFMNTEVQLISTHYKQIMAKEGSSAFFKGVLPRCAIISPLFAITMACYEKFQQKFG